MAQPGQDPAFDDLHTHFHFRFISGFPGTGRDHRNLVMFCQLLVRRVQLRIVTARPADGTFQVIRHEDFRDATEELQRPDVAEQPVGQRLRPGSFSLGVV